MIFIKQNITKLDTSQLLKKNVKLMHQLYNNTKY